MPTVLAAEEVWALEVSQVDTVAIVMTTLERNSVQSGCAWRQAAMHNLTDLM